VNAEKDRPSAIRSTAQLRLPGQTVMPRGPDRELIVVAVLALGSGPT